MLQSSTLVMRCCFVVMAKSIMQNDIRANVPLNIPITWPMRFHLKASTVAAGVKVSWCRPSP